MGEAGTAGAPGAVMNAINDALAATPSTAFTPIINYPEVAILAAGRSKERVLTKDGKFYAGVILPLSLSCDHRVVDGAEGARFLNTVVRLLEDPDTLLG